jgi:plasmid stability protein
VSATLTGMNAKKNLKIRASLHQRLKLYATLHSMGVEAFAEELLEAAINERFAKRGAMDPALARTMAKELAALAAAGKKRKKPG